MLAHCLRSCRRALTQPVLSQRLSTQQPSSLSVTAPQLSFQLQQSASHTSTADPNAEKITVTFYDEKDKSETTVRVPLGENLLEAAHANNVDLEGACEGSLACSTCHVIIEDQGVYDSLPEPDDDENDMLDLAFGLTETSRLGCQVLATKAMDGLRVRIPSATRNFAVDGHVPKPH